MSDSIKFTIQRVQSDSTTGQWAGIRVDNGRIIIEYCEISNAEYGLVGSIISGSIQNSLIKNSSQYGVYFYGGVNTSVVVSQNLIENFNISGIRISNGIDTLTSIYGNNIKNNSLNGSGIYLYDSTPKVYENIITNVSSGIELYRYSSGVQSPEITRNTIQGVRRGISVNGNMQPIINYNNLDGNYDYGIVNSGAYPIDAKYNWWGAGPTAEMASGGNPKNIGYIYDEFDNQSYGFVNYAGWLDGENNIFLDAPTLNTPIADAVVTTFPIEFIWSESVNATLYKLQISTDASFSNLVINDSTIVDTVSAINSLEYFKQYYWRVKAKNVNGVSPWSVVRSFSTGLVSAEAWTSNLEIKDNAQVTETITFGVHSAATDGIDLILGESSLPPIPPVGSMDGRFILPTDASRKDFRSSVLDSIVWKCSFQPGLGGYPITFNWNNSNFPDGTFILQDAITGTIINVNMKLQNSYVLTNSGITALEIHFDEKKNIEVALNEGWNLISVPVITDDMKVATLFPTATSSLFSFDERYVEKTTFELGKGYWLKFGAAEVDSVLGFQSYGVIPLAEGWNMIGVYDYLVSTSAITTNPAGIIISQFYGFGERYIISDTLRVGKGYWIKASQAGELTLTSVLPKQSTNQVIAGVNKEWGKIYIKDRTGDITTLYVADEISNNNIFELPPRPPIGIADVRYTSGRYAEELLTSKVIELSSMLYPLKIRVEGTSISLKDVISGKLLNRQLNDGEEIVVSNEEIMKIVVEELSLPLKYDISQNYPNPFNPSTKIRFSLPMKSKVKLSLYNIRGEKVAELIDGEMEVGYHEVEFNASHLTSGVYFYRISANEYTNVKKMILLK